MTTQDFLTPNEEQNLHSLASALPFIDLSEVYPSPEALHAIPYNTARNQGLICIKKTEDGVFEVACAKPNMIDPETWNALGKPTALYQADEEHIHSLLNSHEEEQKGLLSSRLLQLIPKIRSIKDFGSAKMAKFLPKDHMQEIAHDVASERFWDTIFSYASLQQANEILFDTTEELATVSILHYGVWEELASFSSERNISLIAKLRLWADIHQGSDAEVQEGSFTREVGGENYLYKVTIMETQEGSERILIEAIRSKEGIAKLGLNGQQKYALSLALGKSAGLVLVSGEKYSGKTFGFYSLMEEVEVYSKTHTIEELPVELTLKHTAQSRLGNKASELLQTLVRTKTQAIGVRPMNRNMFLPSWYASHASLIIAETNGSPLEFLEHLHRERIPTHNIALLTHSLLHSHSFAKLGNEVKNYKLSSDEKQSLLKFISNEELQQLFTTAGLMQGYGQESEVPFYTATGKSVHGLSSFLRKTDRASSGEKQYVKTHGYVNLTDVISIADNKKLSKLELQQMLRFEQKKAVTENALIACVKKQIDIKEIIDYIRS